MTEDIERGDALISQILAGGAPGADAARALTREVLSGDLPVENLIPLLRSTDGAVVRTGVFVVEELAGRARPLMPEVPRLLAHPDRWVKGPMVDVVLVAATPKDAPIIARAIALVDDPDPPMRWKALNLLARIDHNRLLAALPEVAAPRISEPLNWLIERDQKPDDGDLLACLEDRDPLVRRFAAVGAARAYERAPDLMDRIVETDDPDLQKFARSQLRSLRRTAARR